MAIGAIIGAVTLYLFTPLIIGVSIGIGAQLGLGIAGAAIGGGIGYLTNVAVVKQMLLSLEKL